MTHRLCACLGLVVLLCLPSAHGEVKDKCGTALRESIAVWLAKAERCIPGILCREHAQDAEYSQARSICARAATPGNGRKEPERQPLEAMLPAIADALAAMEKLFGPFKEDIQKMHDEFDRQLEGVWTDLEELQLELLYSAIGSGRVEKALFYRYLIGGHITNMEGKFTSANVEELLLYAWNLVHYPTGQKNAYRDIGVIVKASKDALLQLAYAIDLANANQTEVKSIDQEAYPESLARLRTDLTTRQFNTMLDLARRYPPRYAYLRQHMGELFGDKKPTPSELLAIVSEFPRGLPTANERLETLLAITKQYLVDNATVTTEPEYIYPMSVLAYEIHGSMVGEPSASDEDGAAKKLSNNVADLFNTPITGRSAEYFSRSLHSKMSA